MSGIRVGIADDHELVRLGLRALIDSDSDMVVVAEAGTAAESLRMVERFRPHVMVLDIRLPDGSGLEVCRKMRRRFPETKIIILTSYISDGLISEAVRSGASGYVLKEVGNKELLRAIRAAAEGETAFGPKSSTQLAKHLRDLESKLEDYAFKDLSAREMDVLRLVAAGKSNKDIGAVLHISAVTVRNYVSNILKKLGLTNRIELALYAVKHNLSSTS
jgi:DNA-binding NarL/FixJ family response regulator